MTDDAELLLRYADTGSESAFSELVARHLPLVYSAALRRVSGDAHLAQDVAQSVFTDLARKAHSVARRLSDDRQVLSGWLYTSARFAASKLVRAECRRRSREQEVVAMQETVPAPASRSEPQWELLRPVLDHAMSQLAATDGDAVLLRYFEGKELKAIGTALGLTEDAARMRVNRALEKLRDLFAQRGVALSAAGLAALVSGNAVQAVPIGLAATVSSVSVVAAASTGITFTIFKVMTMTKLKVGAISALIVAGVATPFVIQHQSLAKLREDNRKLVERNRQISQLQSENRRLTNQLAQTGRAKSLSEEQFRELLRLRGEVNVLRQESQELAKLRTQRRETALPAADSLAENKKMLPADAWADVGMDTPENALQTFFWAAKHDNAVLVGKLIRWQKDASVPEVEGLDEIVASLIPGTIRFASELQGMTILSQHEENGVTARVQVELASAGDNPAKQQEILFVKEDTQWKPVFSVWSPHNGSIQGALGIRPESKP